MWVGTSMDKNRALSHLLLLSLYKEKNVVRLLLKINNIEIVISDTNI